MDLNEGFRLVADATPVLIWTSGSDTRCTWFNRAWLDFVGRSLADELGEGWVENVHPDDVEHRLAVYANAVELRQPFTADYRLRRHDGEYRWIHENGAPCTAASGALTGYVGSGIDVTDDRSSRQTGEDTEQRARVFADALPHLVWTCEPDGWCDYLGPQWVDYTGRPAHEHLGYGWAQQLHPDDRERVRAAWRAATARGDAYDVEFRIRSAAGEYRWFRTRAVPVRNAQGRIVKWFGSNTDCDDYKRAEASLRTELERLRTLEPERARRGAPRDVRLRRWRHDALSGNVSSDRAGQHAELRRRTPLPPRGRPPAAEAASCENASTVETAPSVEVQPQNHRPHARTTGRILFVHDRLPLCRSLCDALARLGHEVVAVSTVDAALCELRAHGFDVLLAGANMPDVNGRPFLEVAADIDEDVVVMTMKCDTVQERMPDSTVLSAIDRVLECSDLRAVLPVVSRALELKQLRAANFALEQRVRQRTLDLEAANGEVEAFCDFAIQDTRSPLRAIRSLSRAVSEDFSNVLPVRGVDLVRRLDDSAGKMEKIVHDLLWLARLSRRPLLRRPVDLDALLSRVVNDLVPSNEGRDVRVRTGQLGGCVGDASLLEQAFACLLSNAMECTRHRAHALIEVGRTAVGEDPVYFVKDNGMGFDMNDAQRLFTPFQRLHAGGNPEGTGVGLTAAYRIVQRHGGEIWAEAAAGRGATFYFTLPGAPSLAAPTE